MPQNLIKQYENIPVLIGEELILCTTAALGNKNTLVPDFQLGGRTPARIYSSTFISNTLDLTYYPSYKDTIYEAIKNFRTLEVNFGGIILKNGKVTSLRLNINPEETIVCQASITFFAAPTASFNGEGIDPDNWAYIKYPEDSKDIALANGTHSILNQNVCQMPLSLDYTYSQEIIIRDVIGEDYPFELRKGKAQIGVDLSCEDINNFVTLNGKNASFELFLRSTCDVAPNKKFYKHYAKDYYKENSPYVCNGVIQSSDKNIEARSWAKSSISVVQYI